MLGFEMESTVRRSHVDQTAERKKKWPTGYMARGVITVAWSQTRDWLMHGVCVMLSQVTSAAPVQLNETYSLVRSQCPETKPSTFAIWLRGCFGAYAQIGEPNSTPRLVAHI